MLNEIEDEMFLNSKIELILSGINTHQKHLKRGKLTKQKVSFFSEEEHLKSLNDNFAKLRDLVKILDNKTLNGKKI